MGLSPQFFQRHRGEVQAPLGSKCPNSDLYDFWFTSLLRLKVVINTLLADCNA